MAWHRGKPDGRRFATVGVGRSDGSRTFFALVFFWPPPGDAAFAAVTRSLDRAGYDRFASEPPPGPNVHHALGPERFSLSHFHREVARLERLVAARGARRHA
jgi:hypothetical protein